MHAAHSIGGSTGMYVTGRQSTTTLAVLRPHERGVRICIWRIQSLPSPNLDLTLRLGRIRAITLYCQCKTAALRVRSAKAHRVVLYCALSIPTAMPPLSAEPEG